MTSLNRPRQSVVTGGGGFLGYHLARYLADRGDNVVIIDNLSRGIVDDMLRELTQRHNVRLMIADLAQEREWRHEIRRADDVYHLAAINGTRHFYERPDEVLRVNVEALLRVLDVVAYTQPRPRLLFTSSNEAYAGGLVAFDQLPFPTPENVPLVIADPYEPRWSYGGSKAFGEQMLIHAARRHRIPAVIVRPHNIYGPRAGTEHVVPAMIERITRREDPFVIVGGEETRSFCYVDDAIRAFVSAMDLASPDVPTLNVGDADEIKIADLAQHLFDIAEWRPATVTILPGKPGSVRRRCPDIQKIHNLTGWRPTTTLQQGLRKTWDA